ncbi:MAG: hypothetical protein ACQERB_01885 [Promethearchaeati archaeon]
MNEKNSKSLLKKFIILVIFLGVIIITAEVDWAAENSLVGLGFRYFWFILLLSLAIILPLLFMYLAGGEMREENEYERKLFIISIILFVIANGIPIIFYVIIGIPPGFFIYLQLALFGLIPAFFPRLRDNRSRIILLVLLYTIIIVPIGILVNSAISSLWAGGDNWIYYLSFWGLLMTFFYLLIAIGWKLGGGTQRQSWNIFVAGTILQYSTLEDFFFFLLNGQSLPGTWDWMDQFVINLEWLFGRVPTDLDLLLFCIITSSIALFVLFDVHGYIWNKLKAS